jgi:hypothetical protein
MIRRLASEAADERDCIKRHRRTLLNVGPRKFGQDYSPQVGFRPLMHGTVPAAFGDAGGDAQPQIVVCVGLRRPQ